MDGASGPQRRRRRPMTTGGEAGLPGRTGNYSKRRGARRKRPQTAWGLHDSASNCSINCSKRSEHL
eukprot:15435851-Alexandrium_andersonii.AAC.1